MIPAISNLYSHSSVIKDERFSFLALFWKTPRMSTFCVMLVHTYVPGAVSVARLMEDHDW